LGSVAVPANVMVVDPVGYREMLALEHECARIATDSGGVQKEAAWARVGCVTMRDETEWVETLAGGWNVLAGADPARIAAALGAPTPTTPPATPSPAGAAAPRIAEAIGRCLT
jgi:UDP-GlcNAc3NAcA epimerase